jgi:tetratricopeptide (TPR) repeat protein
MESEFSKNPLVDKIKEMPNFWAKNKSIIVNYFIAIVAIIGIIIGYMFYKNMINRDAQRDFLTAMQVYNGKVIKTVTDEKLGINEFKSEVEKWEQVDKVFDEMYKKNSGSGIATFFLAYRVDALINLNKLVLAVDVQKELLKKLPSKSNLKPFNQIKLALMQIDTKIEARVKDGLEYLTKLAYDSASPAQDAALYNLGEYYFYEKNYKEAANYWNQLVLKFGKNIEYPSIYVELAKPKLKTIVA